MILISIALAIVWCIGVLAFCKALKEIEDE